MTIGLRDEHTISKRAFLFGEARYLRDRFKELTYYHAEVALATSISSRLELKLGFVDDYKNKPVAAD